MSDDVSGTSVRWYGYLASMKQVTLPLILSLLFPLSHFLEHMHGDQPTTSGAAKQHLSADRPRGRWVGCRGSRGRVGAGLVVPGDGHGGGVEGTRGEGGRGLVEPGSRKTKPKNVWPDAGEKREFARR